jgi:hypothetical protein
MTRPKLNEEERKARHRESQRKWYIANKDYKHEWYIANKDDHNAKCKQWRLAHKDEVRAKAKARYYANLEENREKRRRYHWEHREERREYIKGWYESVGREWMREYDIAHQGQKTENYKKWLQAHPGYRDALKHDRDDTAPERRYEIIAGYWLQWAEDNPEDANACLRAWIDGQAE